MDDSENFSNLFSEEINQLKNFTPTTKDGRALSPLIELFNGFLKQLDAKFAAHREDMMKLSRERENKYIEMQNECVSLKKTVAAQNDKIDELEQYTRRESLVLSGDVLPVAANNEDTTFIACKLINDKIGDHQLQIQPEDIAISHRLGNKPNNGTDKRRIIARFVRRSLKFQVLKAARSKKPDNLFITESLTPTRQLITRALHKMRKDHPRIVTKYYTNNGSITAEVKGHNARDADPASRVTTSTMAALEDFSRKTFQQAAAAFLPKPRSRPTA